MNRVFAAFLAALIFTNTLLGIERVPWTTSRISGSPETPSNFRVERMFSSQTFTNPVDIVYNRALQRWFVAEQGGKLFSFSPDGSKNLAADFGPIQGKEGNLYAFTFDPSFAENRFIYVCYVLKSDLPDGTHISRFKVKPGPEPELDLGSEQLLITWVSGGHNGCCLKFGPDGYLYISTGDGAGPNPPDPLHTGQDLSDLLSSLLRIDIHHAENGKNYAVPSDNPFVGRPNTRPEIWAFGFRNPWRFGIDQTNGQVWVADVGWELWELIYRVERGGNYGWSIVEGRQPVHSTDPVGPTPITPPIKDHPHSEAASITGGFVYHGSKFPTLKDAFIYGDWETGKIWALRAKRDKITYSEELTDTTLRVVAFAEDSRGEIIVLDYNGGIYSLEANPTAVSTTAFPTRLSETGLFSSVVAHQLAAGVVPFQVEAPMWNDHAIAERFLGLPLLSVVTNTDRPWRYPSNAVLVRTLSLEMEHGRPATQKRIETQILHYAGDGWGAYSYRWNEEQTDATLVPAEGAETVFKVADEREPGGVRVQPWRFQARAECLRCHNPWCGTALAFQPEQLTAATIEQLQSRRYLSATVEKQAKHLVSPYDTTQPIPARARSYLHANCSHCHRENAGGSVPAVMNIELPEDKMHMIDARPTRGDLGLDHARVINPAQPFNSVALFRVSSTGRSRMPYIGTRLVDDEGISLLQVWIDQLPASTRKADQSSELRAALDTPDPDYEKLANAARTSTTEALRLAHLAARPSISKEKREGLARAVLKSNNPLVRELFERFIPADERIQISQQTASREQVLALKGDAARGAALLNDPNRLTCLQCHRFQTQGRAFGPDLKKAVQKMSRADILENILQPSRQIAPDYILYTAELADDETVTGIVLTRTDKEIILRDAGAVDHPVPTATIKSMRPQQLSAMPEGLLAGLSAQEVADLLDALIQEGMH